MRTRRTRGWVIAVLGVAVGFGAILVLLPYGIRWAAERWMRQQGQVTVSIGDVDFNPFTGRLGISNLEDPTRRDHLGVGTGGVGVDWLPFFRKRVQVEDVHLSNVSLDAVLEPDGTFLLGDLRFTPALEESKTPTPGEPSEWGVGLGAVDLTDVGLRYRDRWVEIDVAVKSFHLDPVATWAPGRPSTFRLDMELNGGRVRTEGTVTPFGDTARLEASFEIEGLHTVKLARMLEQAGVSGFDAVIDTDARLEAFVHRVSREMGFTWEGELTVSGMKGRAEAAVLDQATITWHGRIEAGGTPEMPTAHARGAVGLEGLHATLTGPGVTVERGSLLWDGTVAYDGTPSAEGALALGPWSVRTLQPDRQAVALEGGEIGGIRVRSPTDIEVDTVVFRELGLLERASATAGADDGSPYHVTAANLSIGGVRVASNRAEVETVGLMDLRVEVARGKDGEVDVLSWTRTAPGEAPPDDGDPEPVGEPWTVRVGEVTVGGASRLGFRDDSVSPPYEVAAEPFELTAGPVDTGNPDLDTTLVLKTRTGKYSSISVEVAGRPLAEDPSGTAEVALEQIHLPSLTPYTQRHLGYRLRSGALDFHTDAKVDAGHLTATNALKLHKLDLEPLDPDQKDELTENLGLPLNTALSLLRDKNDDIELDIPVEGDLDDPEFGIGQAVGKAFTKGLSRAVTTAAITYFAPAALVALGPVGALFAAGKLISLATALRFDPVAFPPGDGVLGPEASAQMDKLGALLTDRPAVRLTLCGVATEVDREAMYQVALAAQAALPPPPKTEGKRPPPPPPPPVIADETLLDLATARAEAVKDRLVADGKVEPARLLVCSPEIETDAEAAPQVLISL